MIDLHTHTLFSDGVLLPSELVYRAKFKGYKTIALTDHGDFSNLDFVIPRIKRIAGDLSRYYDIQVITGVELTYVPPFLIKKAVKKARSFGAQLVVVHGETPAETVPPGTNIAAILSGADILAHPGHILEQEVCAAVKNNVALEITTRRGHNVTNAHVARLAKKCGAKLVMNTDSHTPENLLDDKIIKQTLKMSGLSMKDFAIMQLNSYSIINGELNVRTNKARRKK